MRKKGVCCVDQSIEKLKQRLFAATRRMHKSRSHPPLPEGITPTEGFVLMSISQLMSDGKRVRSGDIAKRGHSTPSATSQALKSLEEKGFITRHRDEGDSRGVTVQLTELGWKYEQMNRRMHDCRLEELLEYLGEDDAREFARITERVSNFESTHPWTAYVERPCESVGDSARKASSRESFAGIDSGEGGKQCE